MGKRTGAQAARPGPLGPGSPPVTRRRQDERHDHDGHPDGNHDTSLDAYVARLVDEAPPLSSEQRDTLALILRRVPGRPPGAGVPGRMPLRGEPVSWPITRSYARPGRAAQLRDPRLAPRLAPAPRPGVGGAHRLQPVRRRGVGLQPNPSRRRQRGSGSSLLRRLEAATARIRQLEADNQQLRDALDRALGERRAAEVLGRADAREQ